MSGSFNALASAAMAKAETIDSHASTITALTKANAELVETNKQLVAALTAAKLPLWPPGFPPAIPAAPTNATGNARSKLTHVELPTVETGHKTNTAGVSCPAVKKSNNKWYFVAPQACNICGKAAILHVPENCREAPHNKTLRKAIGEARAQAQAAVAAGTRA